MDAIDRADLDAGLILLVDAGLGDDERHGPSRIRDGAAAVPADRPRHSYPRSGSAALVASRGGASLRGARAATASPGGDTPPGGWSVKVPGAGGAAPISGAGLYVDNDAGAAGSAGRGEANLQNLSSFMTVENMRNGMSPQEACLATLKRVADKCEPLLRNAKGEPGFSLQMYAL